MRVIVWRRLRWTALIAAAGLLSSTAGLLFVPPPLGVVERLAVVNADWLLTNYMEAPADVGTRLRNGLRKTTSTYIQYGLASGFRRTHQVTGAGTDAERVMRTLVQLRTTMLNQAEIDHAPMQWSSAISGLGYCDQMNAIAANVLGASFDHAQIVALLDPTTRGQHTIGRVWSGEGSEWLYFDLWGDLNVFRLDSAGRPVTLAKQDPYPGALDGETLAVTHALYEFAKTGETFNEYPNTFGGYLFVRAKRALSKRTLDSFAPAPIVVATGGLQRAAKPRLTESTSEVRRQYVSAHSKLVFGRRAEAKAEFGAIASRDSLSVLGQAAAVFAKRLDR